MALTVQLLVAFSAVFVSSSSVRLVLQSPMHRFWPEHHSLELLYEHPLTGVVNDVINHAVAEHQNAALAPYDHAEHHAYDNVMDRFWPGQHSLERLYEQVHHLQRNRILGQIEDIINHAVEGHHNDALAPSWRPSTGEYDNVGYLSPHVYQVEGYPGEAYPLALEHHSEPYEHSRAAHSDLSIYHHHDVYMPHQERQVSNYDSSWYADGHDLESADHLNHYEHHHHQAGQDHPPARKISLYEDTEYPGLITRRMERRWVVSQRGKPSSEI